MSELNREQIISEIEMKTKYARFINTDAVVLSSKAAQFCLNIAKEFEDLRGIAEGYQKQFEDCAEDRARLTEENKVLAAMYSALETSRGIDLFRAREEAIDECKERLQKYYQSLHGTTLPMLVAYHIEEVFKEIKRGMTGEES